jgi:hypothetical protein
MEGFSNGLIVIFVDESNSPVNVHLMEGFAGTRGAGRVDCYFG